MIRNGSSSNGVASGSKHSSRVGPRRSDEPTRLSAQTDPREHAVDVLYQLLCDMHLVQVTGTPGSGKTTLMDLLHNVIREKRPEAQVFVINGWARSQLEQFAFKDRWPQKIDGWDGYQKDDFYLIDEGHTSYWDEELWKDFKDSVQRTSVADAPYVILFCSYNDDLRKFHGMTPPSMGTGRLTLARIIAPLKSGDDMTPVGLLLDRKEYMGILSRFSKKRLLLDKELENFIFEFTAGHVGAVIAMLQYIIKVEEPHMTNGETITFAEFQAQDLTFQKLTRYLIEDFTVSRLLSTDSSYYPAKRQLLVHGPIREDHAKYKDLLEGASKSGLVEFMDRFYNLPSPLHRQVWSWRLMPIDQYKYEGTLIHLIKDTVGRFRPNQLSKSDQCAKTNEQNPPEAQYSHEWYRSLHEITTGSVVISPEYATALGKRRGHVDFYTPSMKWGIEII
ncbi:hypothetical protein FRC20_006290 [Serendipita sp. 405]|nr:hypothetical protein FRC15_006415 [Serendipita sp. 397]KAG8838548.1 hypothetical protein FRC20_006290 [Serendipita sp. 405]